MVLPSRLHDEPWRRRGWQRHAVSARVILVGWRFDGGGVHTLPGWRLWERHGADCGELHGTLQRRVLVRCGLYQRNWGCGRRSVRSRILLSVRFNDEPGRCWRRQRHAVPRGIVQQRWRRDTCVHTLRCWYLRKFRRDGLIGLHRTVFAGFLVRRGIHECKRCNRRWELRRRLLLLGGLHDRAGRSLRPWCNAVRYRPLQHGRRLIGIELHAVRSWHIRKQHGVD